MQTQREYYNELVDELISLSAAYYPEGGQTESPISDPEFDILMAVVRKFEEQWPDFVREDSPTRTVGSVPLSHNKIVHPFRMMSLDNIFDEDQLTKWLKRVKDTSYSVELKYDGLSVALVYVKGNLSMAITRGTGLVGTDITTNVLLIPNIPKNIKTTERTVVLHGEVILSKRYFDSINEELEANDEKPYSNVRNAASGIIQGSGRFCSSLIFMCFDAPGNALGTDYETKMDQVRRLGFDYSLNANFFTADRVIDCITQIETSRKELGLVIDGLVIKAVSNDVRERLGVNRKTPRYAIAWKFAPAFRTTILKDIRFQVSGQGVVNPVAELEPVVIDGVTVSSANLYNMAHLRLLDVMIGDYVKVARVADVNNQITEVVREYRPKDASPIVYPTHCPSCGTELVVMTERKPTLKCPASMTCKAQVIERLKKYLSPEGINVQISRPVLEKLFDEMELRLVSDLYGLTVKTLVLKGGVSTPQAEKILKKLTDALDLPFERHLAVLGIPGIGYAAALTIKSVAPSFGDLYTNLNDPDWNSHKEMALPLGIDTANALWQWHNFEGGKAVIKKMKKLMG